MTAADWMHRLRMFHQAIRLPLGLYEGQALGYALPEQRQSASLLLRGEDPLVALPAEDAEDAALTNQAGESFLYLQLEPGYALLIGPCLKEPVDDQLLLRQVRQLSQDKQLRQQLSKHLKALPRLHPDSLQAIRQLAQEVFRLHEQPEADAFPHLQQLYVMNAMDNRMSLFQHPPYFLEQELGRQIRRHNKQRALDVLHQINRLARATVARDPMRSLKNSLIGSCALISRAAIAGGVSAGEAFTLADSFIQTLEGLSDARSLTALEEAMVLRYCEQVEAAQQQKGSAIVRAAMREVNEHLDEKLSVAEIARRIFVHPDYLSRLFRQETGERLNHFIQRRRVQKASHLLRYTSYSIAEIAAAFQFSSQSNFSQTFKKHTGQSPARFREEAGLTP